MRFCDRNVKKVLALVLAFACAFTMFAGAAFTDESDIQAMDAVSMLTTLGVIEGYEDGSFQPEGTVTRAEMAKMIFVVRNNTADDKAYANVSTSLTDISGHWAEGYIKFCESQGIIAGKGNGIFDPDATVTGTEAAKMLLVLAGYEPDKAGLEGTNWATNTLKHAGAAGILDKVSSALESGLPRQWAAQMIYNTLSANRVIWSADSQSFDTVLNGGVKETVGRAYMGLYNSIGTLVLVDMDHLMIQQTTADENESDPIDTIWDGSKLKGDYETDFYKVSSDYSDLLGQKVRVMFKNGHSNEVLGVFATQENTTYTVAANQTSKDDTKVAFDGSSYRLDDAGRIRTYIDGADPVWTTLDELDSNALNPNMYTFVDSNGNGRLDTLVVETYNVAKVSYAASDKIIAANKTYKYADENIADGIAKNDWVVITRNLFEGKWDIEKVDVQTATLRALNDDNVNKNVYFDGATALENVDYSIYTIGDSTYNAGTLRVTGESAVQSDRSENSLNAVKAGDSVDYVAVNGIIFSVKKSSGEYTGRVDNVALVTSVDATDVSNRVRVRLFDGTTKTVYVDDSNEVKYADPIANGDMYEYSESGDTFTFYDLKNGIESKGGNDRYEGYYGDLTYRGNTIVGTTANCNLADLKKGEFDGMKIDDNAEVILFRTDAKNQSVRITGKQFKNLNLDDIDGAHGGKTIANAAAYAFSGDMNGLDRIGALALKVSDGTNLDAIKSKTWNHYGFILSDAEWIVRNKTMQYDLWTSEGLVTVQEDHNTLTDRKARTAIGYDDLNALSGSANAAALVMRAATEPTHEIEGVTLLNNANSNLVFTAIVDVSNNGKTVKFADGQELDITDDTTVLYVDSDGKTGRAEGEILEAHKDVAGNYLANVLYIPETDDDVDLLIVDQLTYLKSDYYKTMGVTDAAPYSVVYGENAITGNEPTITTAAFSDATKGTSYNETKSFTVKNIADGTSVTITPVQSSTGLTVTADATVANGKFNVTVAGTPLTATALQFTVTVGTKTSDTVTVTVKDAPGGIEYPDSPSLLTALKADNVTATGLIPSGTYNGIGSNVLTLQDAAMDGIVNVVGDTTIDGTTTFIGNGVLNVTGKLTINAGATIDLNKVKATGAVVDNRTETTAADAALLLADSNDVTLKAVKGTLAATDFSNKKLTVAGDADLSAITGSNANTNVSVGGEAKLAAEAALNGTWNIGTLAGAGNSLEVEGGSTTIGAVDGNTLTKVANVAEDATLNITGNVTTVADNNGTLNITGNVTTVTDNNSTLNISGNVSAVGKLTAGKMTVDKGTVTLAAAPAVMTGSLAIGAEGKLAIDASSASGSLVLSDLKVTGVEGATATITPAGTTHAITLPDDTFYQTDGETAFTSPVIAGGSATNFDWTVDVGFVQKA